MRISIAGAVVGTLAVAQTGFANCDIQSITTATNCVNQKYVANIVAADSKQESYSWTSSDGLSFDSPSKFATAASTDFNECSGSATVTLESAGSTCTATFAYSDTTPPVIHGLYVQDITVQLGDVPAKPEGLTTFDDCRGTTLQVEYDESPVSNGYIRTWVVDDNCGNKSTYTQDIIVIDTAPPQLTNLPDHITVSADAIPVKCEVGVVDADPSAAITDYSEDKPSFDESVNCTNGLEITRTWKATDSANNETVYVQTISLIDEEAPKFVEKNIPNLTVECNNVPVEDAAQGIDNISGTSISSTVETSTTSTTNSSTYTLERVFTLEDKCENSRSHTQTITVIDSTPPTYGLYQDSYTIECDAAESDLASLCQYDAYDNCDDSVTVTREDTDTADECANNYTKVVVHTATDNAGLSTVKEQTIKVVDTTPPQLNHLPPDLSVECIESVNYVVECVDNCDADCEVIRVIEGDLWTYSASDSCGNSVSHSSSITVSDVSPPSLINVPANETVPCELASQSSHGDVGATDNCAVDGNVSASDQTINIECDHSYQIVRTFSVSDESANSTSAIQTITIRDTAPPSFSGMLETDVTAECDSVPSHTSLSAEDNCSTNVTVIFAETTGTTTCDGNYSLSRTWAVSDDCGNTNMHTAIVSVQDITPPEFTQKPASPESRHCHEYATMPQTDEELVALIDASDNCSAAIDKRVTWTPYYPNDCVHNYYRVADYTIEDECGNTNSYSYTVNFTDTTEPTIDCTNVDAVGDLTIEWSDAPSNYSNDPTVDDNCFNNTVKLKYNDVTSGLGCGHKYKEERLWYAEDECGTKSHTTCRQTITVDDNIDPIFLDTTTAEDATIECSDTGTIANLPTVLQYCDPDEIYRDTSGTSGICVSIDTVEGEFSQTTVSQDNNTAFVLKREWIVKDECNNTQTKVQMVTIEDVTPPELVGDYANYSIEADTSEAQDLIGIKTLTVTDNCNVDKPLTGYLNLGTVNYLDMDGDSTTYYEVIRTWESYDVNNNGFSYDQTITVLDSTPPQVTCPTSITSSCDSVENFEDLTYSDNSFDSYGIANKVPNSDENFVQSGKGCDEDGVINYSDSVTDVNGQITECIWTQHVYDTSPPSLTVAATTTYECGIDTEVTWCAGSADASACVNGALFAVSDNCDTDVEWSMLLTDTPKPTDQTTKLAYTNIYSYTANDNCGNATTVTRTSEFYDNTPPTITPKSNKTTPCEAEQVENWLVDDDCDNFLSLTTTENPNSVPNVTCDPGTYTVTHSITATDAVGNTSSSSYTDSSTDSTPPTLDTSLVVDVTVDYDDWLANTTTDPEHYDPADDITPSDNCTPVSGLTVDCTRASRVSEMCAYEFSNTWTCTTVDQCGKVSAPFVRTINVIDNKAPVFDPTFDFSDKTMECDTLNLQNSTVEEAFNMNMIFPVLTAEVHYGVDGTQVVTPTPVVINSSYFSEYCQQIEYTFTLSDDCSNTSTEVVTVSIEDSTPPTIVSCPSAETYECDAFLDTSSTHEECTYADTCSTDDEIIIDYEEFNDFDGCAQEYEVIRAFIATDLCGNTVSNDLTYLVSDSTPPTVDIPDEDVSYDGSEPFPDIDTVLTDCSEVTITESCGSCMEATGDCSDEGGTGRRLLRASLLQKTQTGRSGTIKIVNNKGEEQDVFFMSTEEQQTVERKSLSNTNAFFNSVKYDRYIETISQKLNAFTTLGFNPGKPDFTQDLNNFKNTYRGKQRKVPQKLNRPGDDCVDNGIYTQKFEIKNSKQFVTTKERVIEYRDITPPVLHGKPQSTTVNTHDIPTASSYTSAFFATDVIDGSVQFNRAIYSESTASWTNVNEFTLERTWTARDRCNNEATHTQTIVVEDIHKNIIENVPDHCTRLCNEDHLCPTPQEVEIAINHWADDNSQLAFDSYQEDVHCDNDYKQVFNWTATDPAGNIATAVYTLTVIDQEAPTFSGSLVGSRMRTVNCEDDYEIGAYDKDNTNFIGASDNCDDAADVSLVYSVSEVGQTGACLERTVYRKFTATDTCGNQDTMVETVTVRDIEPPTITRGPQPETSECTQAAVTDNDVVATDNCTGVSDLIFGVVPKTTSQDCKNQFEVLNTWTVTDECGRSSSFTQLNSVIDKTPPSITVQGGSTKECVVATEQTSITYWPQITTENGFAASDICDTAIDVNDITVISTTPSTDDCVYSHVRVYGVADDCGRQSTDTQTITITDNTPPTIQKNPVNTSGECTYTPVLADYETAAGDTLDDCSYNAGTVASVKTKIPMQCEQEEDIMIDLTSTDDCGNTSVYTVTHQVRDTTPPYQDTLISMHNLTYEKDCSEINVYTPPSDLVGQDNCHSFDGVLTPEKNFVSGTATSFTETYTWTLGDTCGNTTVYVYSVSYTDIGNPTIEAPEDGTLPADVTIDCADTMPSFDLPASDGCATTTIVGVQQQDETIDNSICGAESSVKQTWIATDLDGNKDTHTRIVVVDDSTPPTFTDLVRNDTPTTAECDNIPSMVDYQYNDDCSDVTYISSRDYNDKSSDKTSSKYSNYKLVDEYSITDDCGNEDSYVSTIIVSDNTPPTITNNYTDQNLELSHDMRSSSSFFFKLLAEDEETMSTSISAQDACGGETTIAYNLLQNTDMVVCTAEFAYVQQWVATDNSGLSLTSIKSITVLDTTPPQIPVPADETNDCTHVAAAELKASDSGEQYHSQNENNITVQSSQSSSLEQTGTSTYKIVYTYTASDLCGNSTTETQTITVIDVTPPTFTMKDDGVDVTDGEVLVYECSSANPVEPVVVTVADVCDTGIQFSDTSEVQLTVEESEVSRTKYTYWAQDGDSNSTTVTYTVVLEDNSPPSLDLGEQYRGDETIECDSQQEMLRNTNANDGCELEVSGVMYELDVTDAVKAADSTGKVVKATEYTWSAVDEVGNTFTSKNTVTVIDTTPPVLNHLIANGDIITAECSAVPDEVTPSQSDSCVETNGSLVFDYDEVPFDVICTNEYKLLRTNTLTDDNGNVTTHDYVVEVSDNTPPTVVGYVVTKPDQECSAIPDPDVLTVTDLCTLTNNQMTIEGTINDPGAIDTDYTFTRTYRYIALDDCGLEVTAAQTILVVDTTPPVMDIDGVANKNASAFSYSDMAKENATCNDNCDDTVLYPETSQVRNDFQTRTAAACWEHVVTFTCTDANNNETVHNQKITITDSTPPVINNACASLAASAKDSSDIANNVFEFEHSDMPDFDTLKLSGVYATDANEGEEPVDLTASKTTEDYNAPGGSGNPHLYTETWTYTAVDYCNNETVEVCTIVAVDNTGPPMPAVENIVAECDAVPEPCDMTPIGEDAEDLSIQPVLTTSVENADGNSYDLIRQWVATDAENNAVTRIQTVTVQDTTPPVLSRYPANDTVACDCAGLPDEGQILAIDNCDSTIQVTFNESEEVGSEEKTTKVVTRTWTAADVNGHSVSHTQVITLEDTEAPRFFPEYAAGTVLSVDCDNTASSVGSEVIAMDNCDESLGSVIYTPTTNPQSCDFDYDIVETWTVTDNWGNESTQTRTVQVRDDKGPSAASPNQDLRCVVVGSGVTVASNIAADFDFSDNCSNVVDVNVTCDGGSYDEAADTLSFQTDSETTITCTVTAQDSCANPSDSGVAYIRVVDNAQTFASLNCKAP